MSFIECVKEHWIITALMIVFIISGIVMIILGATEYSIETITIEGLKKSKISTKSSSKS